MNAWGDQERFARTQPSVFAPNWKALMLSGLAGWVILGGIAFVAYLAWCRV